ncbi:hypothetical protein [Hymenobacter sp. UYCo722]|uniref:acyl carrier protein n=1 Tax=Hymenobacter sp. UYCo722 TaxID=3156335 RepID=UPI003391F88A
MTTIDLQERVFALVRKQVWHLRRPVLTRATHLRADLGLNLLERVQLGIRLEYDLGIEILDTEIGQWNTLADVLACVERYLPVAGLHALTATYLLR